MEIVLSNLSPLLAGLWITLSIAVLSFIGAMVIGTLVAVMRISPVAPLRAVGLVYVEFFRNIPLLCLLFLVVFGLPDIGVLFNLYNSAVIAMAMFSGAFVCESIRTGINTVQVGQAEAARSIGLTFAQSLRFVILPQALRSMVQPLVNVWIGTLIGSSLASVIGIQDVTAVGQNLNNRYAGGLAVFASIAAIYVVIALLSGGVGGWIERRVAVLDESSRRVRPGQVVTVMSSTRVLFDEPGPRASRRIRMRRWSRCWPSRVSSIWPIARFADSGQLAAAKWSVFTSPLVRAFLWDGLRQHHEADRRLRAHRVAARRAVCAAPVGAQQNRALRWVDRLCRGVPVGAAVVAGADVRPGPAAARASTCRSSGRSASLS